MTLYREATEASEDKLSFLNELYDLTQGRYTNLGLDRPELWAAIRQDFSSGSGLQAAVRIFQQEIGRAMEREIGKDVSAWMPVPVYTKLLRIVAILSGRVFVGKSLCYDEEWLDASINYTKDVGKVIQEIAQWQTWARPFVGPWLRSIKDIRRRVSSAERVLKPLVVKIVNGDNSRNVEIGSSGTLIKLLVKYLPLETQTVERITADQLLVCMIRGDSGK